VLELAGGVCVLYVFLWIVRFVVTGIGVFLGMSQFMRARLGRLSDTGEIWLIFRLHAGRKEDQSS
jgi:hypothetical protein